MPIKTRRSFSSFILILILIFFALPASGEKATPENKATAPEKKTVAADTEKVAVVNGTVINKKSYDQEYLVLRSQIEQSGQKIGDNQLGEFKKHVLTQMITSELLYQDSKKKGISISDEQLAQNLSGITARFPSPEAFKAALAEMNMTEAEMKAKLSKSLAIKELVTNHIVKDATVSDDEAKAFYEMRSELFMRPASVKASHILIKAAPDAAQTEKDKAMEKVKEIQEKLKNGEDFAELARHFSEGPSRDKGGDLGFFSQGQMVKPFEAAAFALSPGEISDVVETRFGYHLIKLMEKKEGEKVPFETAREKIKQNLEKNKSKQQVDQHIDMLLETAKIEKFI